MFLLNGLPCMYSLCAAAASFRNCSLFQKGGLLLLLSLQNRVSPKSEARINLVLSLETQVWTADYKLRKALSKK